MNPRTIDRRAERARAAAPLAFLASLLATLLPACGPGGPESGAPPGDASSASPAEPAGDPWFEEVARQVGVDFRHRSGHREEFYMPEIMCGGVAMFDYDGDSDLDLYFVQGGDLNPGATDLPGNVLYRNRGDGTFENATEEAGVGDRGYGMGVACGDYDNDGDVDLYVTNAGPNVLYRNNGDGTFTDVTAEAGVGDPGFGTSAAFVDYDGDGNLDLYTMNYVVWSRDREVACRSFGRRDYCSPNSYRAPAPDVLYRNEGNGKFRDVSREAGVAEIFGNGLGVSTGDFDSDGDMDIYVANDQMPNQLWMNQGNGRFRDEALVCGNAVSAEGRAQASMGVISIDIDDDGDLDLFMSHISEETNTLYINTNGRFDDTTAVFGLAAASWDFTGFGLGFHDFDHDGRLDLFIANGRVMMRQHLHDPNDVYAEPDILFRGVADGKYEEIVPRGGTVEKLIATSRGVAFGDIDGDGDIDAAVINRDGPAHIRRNIVGNRGNWIRFRVENRHGSPAVGALVRLEAGGAGRWRRVDPAYSYCSSNDPCVHWGLGATTKVDRVLVRWTDGREATFGPFEAGRTYEIRDADERSGSTGER